MTGSLGDRDHFKKIKKVEYRRISSIILCNYQCDKMSQYQRVLQTEGPRLTRDALDINTGSIWRQHAPEHGVVAWVITP